MGFEPSKLFDFAIHIAGVVQDLENMGLRVQIGDDFVKYRALRIAQVDRAPVYPMFDVARSYIDRRNGFWVCAFDDKDDLIHTQAIRLLDLEGMSLATHLELHRHKYITPDTTPDPDATYFTGPSALQNIGGRIAYQGDFWLRARGLGGPRSQGATALLSQLLLELATQAWNPDFVFAFVPKALAAKGAHLRYGYTHCEPGQWIGPDQQVTDEDHLIWMNKHDLLTAFKHASRSDMTPRGAPKSQPKKAEALAI